MKKERKVWAITLIAFWWLAPNQTNAQQDSLKTTLLGEVVITASKFPKNQSETGKVLAIIDEAQLERSNGKDLAQLLNEQVGLVIGGANSNQGKEKSVFLRGAGSEYTLILLDGIPVNDPSGVGGAFDLRMLPIDQVERIEILKGSQSTLYGSDAIAGVINIITKKKADKPLGGFGTLTYGSYNTFRGNAGVTGSTKILDYNVGYTRFQTDGISEAKDESGNANFDKDGYTQNSLQLTLGFNPTAKLSLRPFARVTDYDGHYDAGGFADDKTAVFTSRFNNYGLTGQYTLPKGAVNLQYAGSATERNFESSAGKYPYKGNFDNTEIFFNQDIGSNFQVLAGLNYQNLNMADETAVKKNPAVNITSPYVSFFVRDLNGFSAEGGARNNHHSQFGNAFTYSLNPSFLIQKRLKLFANYSTGFKAPTLGQLYGPFGANDKLKPEVSGSTEGGLQFIAGRGAFDIRITWFNRKIENAIAYASTGYVNLNEQNAHGLEIESHIKVNDKVSLRAFYALVDGEITTKTFAGRDTTFSNLLRRPKNSVGLNVAFQITKSFFASVNLKTFGKRKDTFFDQNDFSTKSVDLSAYQLLDVYAEYKLIRPAINFFVDAKNVLNQTYMEVYGYNTMRFNVNAGITLGI